jgi:hypothetical protein
VILLEGEAGIKVKELLVFTPWRPKPKIYGKLQVENRDMNAEN